MKKRLFQKCGQLFQAAGERGKDAETLKKAGRYTGAVYLKGYQLECLLKWRLLEQKGAKSLADLEESRAIAAFHHDLDRYWAEILNGVSQKIHPDKKVVEAFKNCNNWSVQIRYSPNVSNESQKKSCEGFFEKSEIVMDYLRSQP